MMFIYVGENQSENILQKSTHCPRLPRGADSRPLSDVTTVHHLHLSITMSLLLRKASKDGMIQQFINEAGSNSTDSDDEKKIDASKAPPTSIVEPDEEEADFATDELNLTTANSIDYSKLDDTPYEHGFEPGDHVIRWDLLPILWPIQIHGIVLEVSEDKTTVTICDFGITTVKQNTDDAKNSNSMEKMVEEDDAKLKEVIGVDGGGDPTLKNSDDASVSTSTSDAASETNNNNKKKLTSKKKNKRLNVIKLTKWSDLRKWSKVDYLNGGIAGGMGKGLKSFGEKTEKLWTSVTKSFVKNESTAFKDDAKVLDGEDGVEISEMQTKIVAAVNVIDGVGDGDGNSQQQEEPAPTTDESATNRESSETETTEESQTIPDTVDEPKTLAEMIAEANEVEKRRKAVVKSPPGLHEKKKVEKQQSWHGNLMKSLSNIFPQKDDDKKKDSVMKLDSTPSSSATNKANKEDSTDEETLPRSDPPVLVLARTRFLLEQGEEFLPPYHIVNSNSECIAVWCKTGRWSTLQASIYLHTTAIGNIKSTTALTLGIAATQPWLLPAMAVGGIAAIGTPWLLLKVANDKWNEATMSLTEAFWMQADPGVYVECIEKWGRLK